MSRKTPVKRSPLLLKKQPRKTAKPGKLRPKREPDAKVRHGVWSLDKLLREDLDGRLKIVKHRDQLESQLIDHCGGLDNLTPPLLSLVKRITHKEIVLQHGEKMALLGKFNLADKSYTCLANSLRLDLQALENMLKNRPQKRVPTLAEIIEAEANEKS